MGKFLEAFFTGLVNTGSIEIETAGGHKLTLGDGSGPKLGVRFNDTAAPAVFMLDPELNFGELYTDGRIEVIGGTISDVLMLNAANMWRPDGSFWVFLPGKTRSAPRRLRHSNDLLRTRRNVSHHYDLDATFYTRFLSSIPGCNIPAPISSAMAKISKERSSPKAAYRGETPDRTRPKRPRYWLRLWRHGDLSGPLLLRQRVGKDFGSAGTMPLGALG